MTVLVAQRGFEIGLAIRELRDERVFTQRELAELAGVHEITISDLERGKRHASAKTVRKLAAAFGFNAQELLKRARELEADPTRDVPHTEEEETNIARFKERVDRRRSEGEDSGERGD